MATPDEQEIVPGVFFNRSGEARVDPALTDVLLDIALALEDVVHIPVDVEHVLGAVVLAAQNGDVEKETKLSSSDVKLREILAKYVRRIFQEFGGRVGADD